MSTKQRRKYGEVRKGAETTAGTNESVFNKFLPPIEEKSVSKTPPSTRPSTRPSQPNSLLSHEVAPTRDFQKVANSITREAVPGGLFNGKAKQLYDCLYSLTRGAIVPSRSVRIARSELMKKSDIGAKVTLEQNLRRLVIYGLVSIKTIGGVQGGNEYTVHLPEEVSLLDTPPSTGTSPPSPPSGGQKLGLLAPLETSPPRGGLSNASSIVSEEPKTSFKTKEEKTDDEATRQLGELFKQLEREVIGKNSASLEQWREVCDVLLAELRIAAARTSVSSVPAFMAEHLRRRLWKMDKKQAVREGKELPDQTAMPPQANPVECPDCNGSGWWYPNGLEKGVAKCKHEKVTKAE